MAVVPDDRSTFRRHTRTIFEKPLAGPRNGRLNLNADHLGVLSLQATAVRARVRKVDEIFGAGRRGPARGPVSRRATGINPADRPLPTGFRPNCVR